MRRFALGSLLAVLLPVFTGAEPIAKPEAVPQQLTNNAPFSGAVYIVSPDGGQVVAQGTNMCPASASVSCANVNQPSWCCPSNYVCASPANSNGLIGCCPSGNTCGGSVNVASITTVTVYPQQQTAIVYANPAPHTTVYNQPPNQAQGGFCATITMDGPGLPRTAQGECGTILLVSGAPGLKVLGIGATMVAIMLHVAFGKMFSRL
ncbi:hypothetical protein HBI56_101150 [Parastagonospora nodorum]|nr:hypothetical protein HBH53_178770 [Parastagonospora nodorum]KAH3959245.1 hypothetical protein HBH51_201120 [Parastagonospora nodorum]KAH3984955.1 hypothetical protein HBH52_050760 [Parastagonospora nodorum]KAH4005853.1 hypothetical protein HBI10_022920 [Parastagonospora nodorum]KAH4011971.1 hypothetical protein HBI13_193280 [Parastagonospora nodorum]